MPSSSVFQARTFGAVAQSTMASSATDSIGSRKRGFPARKSSSSVLGGDFTVVSVVVTPSAAATVAALATLQLSATPKIASGDTTADPVTWASSDATVATVGASSGLVTGVAAGSANITATAGGTDSTAVAITVPA